MQMTETAARLTGLHPGLLSGLVLAGANRPAEDDADAGAPVRDDGYLTASEVMLLDLSGVDLVVLSACDTGLGRPQSGEGLIGLRRAFRMAGSKTVISSLWSVKDESTSELMQSFYANLFFKGMGRHEALRTAQLEMLARNRAEHGRPRPSTWGPFVLSGEWR
jgi:CHAT domain-containing protein